MQEASCKVYFIQKSLVIRDLYSKIVCLVKLSLIAFFKSLAGYMHKRIMKVIIFASDYGNQNFKFKIHTPNP